MPQGRGMAHHGPRDVAPTSPWPGPRPKRFWGQGQGPVPMGMTYDPVLNPMALSFVLWPCPLALSCGTFLRAGGIRIFLQVILGGFIYASDVVKVGFSRRSLCLCADLRIQLKEQ